MTIRILNYYQCPDCDYSWEREEDCKANDDCPDCGSPLVAPYATEDISGEPTQEEMNREA